MSETTEDALDIREPLTWADTERDLSAWLGNQIQKEAAYSLYALETKIKKTKNTDLLKQWRYLQVSDHFYYMCTKWFNDGDVHKYFNPYDSPYDAYINYMNVLRDLESRL
jgi:alpha-amylase